MSENVFLLLAVVAIALLFVPKQIIGGKIRNPTFIILIGLMYIGIAFAFYVVLIKPSLSGGGYDTAKSGAYLFYSLVFYGFVAIYGILGIGVFIIGILRATARNK